MGTDEQLEDYFSEGARQQQRLEEAAAAARAARTAADKDVLEAAQAADQARASAEEDCAARRLRALKVAHEYVTAMLTEKTGEGRYSKDRYESSLDLRVTEELRIARFLMGDD